MVTYAVILEKSSCYVAGVVLISGNASHSMSSRVSSDMTSQARCKGINMMHHTRWGCNGLLHSQPRRSVPSMLGRR
jgi:hypothetical protein